MAVDIAHKIKLELPPVNFYAIASRYCRQLFLPTSKILCGMPHLCSCPQDAKLDVVIRLENSCNKLQISSRTNQNASYPKEYWFHNHTLTQAGSKRLDISTKSGKSAYIFWDLSRAKYGAGPEPQTGFYIAIVIDGEIVLLVGDSSKEAYAKTKARNQNRNQTMVVRREHVYGNKLYTTKANFGGKERNISVDCRIGDDPRLYIAVDNKRVLQIKHLKWKFRGNERIEVDGVNVQVSWDVYNWLFEEDREEGYALFTFRFEDEEDYNYLNNNRNRNFIWSQQSFGFGFETKKMKKGLLRSAGSSSSSSLSSVSSSCSSVMEWASMEENELKRSKNKQIAPSAAFKPEYQMA
ncbi:NADPH oxidase [Forsythia ovata]|uniref:NADPH oxidase n=1 Tax=Forsythia ovata TaxID=205694 RepID=A0ABD1WG02_9LAMI